MCTKEVELRDTAHRVTIIDAGRKRGERGGRRAAGEREDYADESTGVTSFGMYFPLRFELRGNQPAESIFIFCSNYKVKLSKTKLNKFWSANITIFPFSRTNSLSLGRISCQKLLILF